MMLAVGGGSGEPWWGLAGGGNGWASHEVTDRRVLLHQVQIREQRTVGKNREEEE